MKKILSILIILILLVCFFTGCNGIQISEDYLKPYESTPSVVVLPTVEPSKTEEPLSSDEQHTPKDEDIETETKLPEDGTYNSRDDVALYVHQYGKLPLNYISKKEAQNLGWDGGSVEIFAPGKSIGGSRFGNYEGLLPEKEGRYYTECDIDTLGKASRGAKRIVYSNDGLIYYTDDHYESFTLLYGEDKL